MKAWAESIKNNIAIRNIELNALNMNIWRSYLAISLDQHPAVKGPIIQPVASFEGRFDLFWGHMAQRKAVPQFQKSVDLQFEAGDYGCYVPTAKCPNSFQCKWRMITSMKTADQSDGPPQSLSARWFESSVASRPAAKRARARWRGWLSMGSSKVGLVAKNQIETNGLFNLWVFFPFETKNSTTCLTCFSSPRNTNGFSTSNRCHFSCSISMSKNKYSPFIREKATKCWFGWEASITFWICYIHIRDMFCWEWCVDTRCQKHIISYHDNHQSSIWTSDTVLVPTLKKNCTYSYQLWFRQKRRFSM